MTVCSKAPPRGCWGTRAPGLAMKQSFSFFGALCASGFAFFNSACAVEFGSGRAETESRSISAARELEVCCGFEIRVFRGDERRLSVRTDDNLLDDLVTRVEGSRLIVEWRDDWTSYQPKAGVQVDVTLPDLERISASGGSVLEVDELTNDRVRIELSGASELEVDAVNAVDVRVELSGASRVTLRDVSASELHVESSGASTVRAEGVVDFAELSASAMSRFQLFELSARDVEVELSGASTADVNAVDSLRIEASGASVVTYAGDPRLDVQLSGGSEVGEK